MEASDKLTISDLVNVGNTFSREKFQPGKIYFLNTQKLSKHSLLVRGGESDDSADADTLQPIENRQNDSDWDAPEIKLKPNFAT